MVVFSIGMGGPPQRGLIRYLTLTLVICFSLMESWIATR